MKRLREKAIFHSDKCEAHNINKMVIGGNVVCPRCENEKSDRQLTQEINEQYTRFKQLESYNTLFSKSILEDKTLLDARFDSYIVNEEEERANKQIVLECAERYKRGEKFNLVLQGKQGTGKSHLAYSTLYELNQSKSLSCLFISVDAMLRKIKNSFNDKESKFTEEYFNKLLSTVDFLVLDDLGAETGAMDSDRKATDFVQRVLYSATNVRQDKATILTTNLDSKKLFSMYDKKLVSRLMKNPKFVIFKDSQDKRIMNIPF